MPNDWKRDAFEKLEPPPGGLTRLRARLDEGPAHNRAISWAYGLSSVAAGALAIWMIMRPPSGPPDQRVNAADVLIDDAGMHHAALVTYGLASAPTEPVTIAPNSQTEVATYRVDSGNEDVIFYWVSRPAAGRGDAVDK